MLLGLAGKTNDESCAKPDAWNAGADAADEVFYVLAGSLAAHEREHFGMDVLEGHIDVAGCVGIAGDRGDQVVAPMSGVSVQKSHPEFAADLPDLIEKMNERGATGGIDRLSGPGLLFPKIHAVVGSILADKVDFLHALGNKAANLANNRIQRAAAMATAHLRNNTKTARMVAAFRDFDIDRVVRCETKSRRGKIWDIAGLWRHQIERAGFLLTQDSAENGAGFGDLVEPDEGIDLGEFAGEVGGEALRETTAHHNLRIWAGALVALAIGFKNRIDRLLLRGINKPASVDDEEVGLGGIGRDFKSLGFCRSEHDLGINKILGATQADHSYFLRGIFCGW